MLNVRLAVCRRRRQKETGLLADKGRKRLIDLGAPAATSSMCA
jgi:hypothetical protein